MRGQSTEQLLSYTNRIGLWQAWSVASTAHHIKANASLARYEAERARRDDELPFGVSHACQVRKLAHHLHSSTQLIKTALSSAQVSTHNSAQSIRRAGGAEITERRIGHLDSEVIGFHRAEVLRNDHIQHFPAVHCPEHTWLEILIIDHLEKRVLSIDRSAMPTPHTYQIMQSNHRPHRAARVWVF